MIDNCRCHERTVEEREFEELLHSIKDKAAIYRLLHYLQISESADMTMLVSDFRPKGKKKGS